MCMDLCVVHYLFAAKTITEIEQIKMTESANRYCRVAQITTEMYLYKNITFNEILHYNKLFVRQWQYCIFTVITKQPCPRNKKTF